jgi:uncharacterized protein YkwD
MSKPITASYRYFGWVRVAAIAATFMVLLSSCSKTGIQTSSGGDVSSTEVLSSIEPAELFGSFDEESAEELMTSINAIRSQEGLDPYLTDDNLMEWARVRAAEIVILFGHTRLDGSSIITAYPGESATKFESSLAMGYESPQDVMQAYQLSDGQRSRILNEEYTHFGVACLTYGGSKYWTVVYLLP